jgi:Zn-dependent peptidase ImmA (M78 family)
MPTGMRYGTDSRSRGVEFRHPCNEHGLVLASFPDTSFERDGEMTSVTWRHLAGDTKVLALDVALLRDEDEPFDHDLAASWGMFSLWVDGVNLCAHDEEAERLEGVHWYLLPLLEWLVESWDPLLHEERLPAPRVADAPRAAARVGMSLRSPATDWGVAESLYAWRARHSWRTAADGGLFPDIWIRRWRDQLEVAVGTEAEPGQPGHFRFRAPEVYRVDAADAAAALSTGVEALAEELLRRRPTSERLSSLVEGVRRLADGRDRYQTRLAWLSGSEGASPKFNDLVKQVEDVFAEEGDTDLLQQAVGQPGERQVLLTGARVALLLGSSSPSINESDVRVLSRIVLSSVKKPEAFAAPALNWFGVSGSAGQQGGALGEDAYWALAADRIDKDGWVDIAALLESLNVAVFRVTLSDPGVRAVSVVANGQGACIAVNSEYKHGTREAVLRFTLAHELAHLLLDRERGVDLAITSGDWAPQAIEQRANAFAAAFLMPTKLVLAAMKEVGGDVSDYETVKGVATRLKVSVASLADRLYNLELLTRDDRDIIGGQSLSSLRSGGSD